jgi:hypothetical protein
VSVIEVDTEGAELWVLQGGAGLLEARKPPLFLELQPANLHCYPHGVYEVIRWLNERRYRVYTFEGTRVTTASVDAWRPREENFVARRVED